MQRVAGLGLLIGFLAAGQTAAQGSCGWERCFGAFAFGPGGAIARTSGYSNAPEAVETALALCGSSCSEYEVFWNACGAVFYATGGTRGFGWGDTQEAAWTSAKTICEDNAGTVCHLRDWVCSL